MGRRAKIGLGVVLVLAAIVILLWPGASAIYGTWSGALSRLPLIPFALLCAGLWLMLRSSPKKV
jgi:hypothetical protein